MIIWINGAFGVGKSHTAYELARRIDHAFLFDPETVGFFLRAKLPGTARFDNFQYIPLWREQVLQNLLYCDQHTPLTIVPMTLVDDQIFDYIIGGLRTQAIDVKHYTLMASKTTVEKRLIRRGDKNAWNFKQVDRCLASLSKPQYATQIDTDTYSLDEVVEFIAKEAGQTLTRGRLSGIRKKLNWLKTTLKQIR